MKFMYEKYIFFIKNIMQEINYYTIKAMNSEEIRKRSVF